MFKLLLLIDCDECGYPLSQATVCCVRDPVLWEETIEAIMFEAQEKGWSFYREYCCCPQCGYEQEVETTVTQLRMLKEKSGPTS